MNPLKICSCCKTEKSLVEFGSHKGKRGNKDGLQPWCKKCKNQKHREYKALKRKTDIKYRLDHRMSNNVSRQLKTVKSGRKWKELVGYSTEELISHLETLFQPGMTWENYGTFWHVDHVIPKSFFKYEDCDEVFKACWALTNLQPLSAQDNWKKNNKVPNPFL